MSKETKTKITKIQYNSNGTSGEPFYSVKFIYSDDGVYTKGTKFELTAIINEKDLKEKDGWSRCYVISNNLSKHWRGDNFGDIIINAIKNYEDERINKLKLIIRKI